MHCAGNELCDLLLCTPSHTRLREQHSYVILVLACSIRYGRQFTSLDNFRQIECEFSSVSIGEKEKVEFSESATEIDEC